MQNTKQAVNKAKRLIIHAPNVHTGGGAVLLDMLLAALPENLPCTLCVDARFKSGKKSLALLETVTVKPTLWHRLLAEWRLRKLVDETTVLLCFGNLPPLFNLVCPTVVFLQNRYLVDERPAKVNFRLWLRERFGRVWLKMCYKHANHYWVQTQTMQALAKRTYLADRDIAIKAFFAEELPTLFDAPPDRINAAFKFIYIASNYGHKNHTRLLKAWVLLAEAGYYPELQLTLDPRDEPQLKALAKEKELKVEFLGELPYDALIKCYERVDALVFPSLFESCGLPLLEAASRGLAIIASERDYVRDLVDPKETFDPLSAVSIMRSVLRFMKQKTPRVAPLSPEGFIQQLLEVND